MGKLYSVQYLRACAALLVVVAHALSYQIGLDDPLVVLAGQLGVTLFFVISGFIMVHISGPGSFGAADFLRRRALRIVPLYWLFTGLAALLAALLPQLFQRTVFTWPHFAQSLFFIVHEAPGGSGTSPMLSLGWTLNYEAYFYLVFATLAFTAVVPRVAVLTALFLCTWLLGLLIQPADPVLRFYLNASPVAFAVGSWIGLASVKGKLAPNRRVASAAGLVAVVGLVLALADGWQPAATHLGLAGQIAASAAILLLGLLFERRLWRSASLERLGDASYALYLSHMFAIGAVAFTAKRVFHIQDVALISATCVAAAVATGLVVHRLIEKPLLRLFKDRWEPARVHHRSESRFPAKESQGQVARALDLSRLEA